MRVRAGRRPASGLAIGGAVLLASAALAAALDDVIAEPERARVLGAAGRLYALSAFAPESAAQRYADIYKKVVDHKPA